MQDRHPTRPARSTPSAANADDGFFFISAKINIDNTGSGELAQNAEALVLELAGGGEGKFQYLGPGTKLPTAGPPPGTSSDPGWRTWEVPNGTRAATLSYRPTADLEIRFAVIAPTEIRDRWLEGGKFKINPGLCC